MVTVTEIPSGGNFEVMVTVTEIALQKTSHKSKLLNCKNRHAVRIGWIELLSALYSAACKAHTNNDRLAQNMLKHL
jgi:hypothetical protein